MKKIILATIIGFTIYGCSGNKAGEKALLDSVIKIHDKVMTDDEAIMKNKMQLKNLASRNIPAADKDSVTAYTKLLDSADDVMMVWMNKFNPDFKGKSHDEVMTYLNEQKTQIIKVDSQLNSAITASNKYLVKFKGK